MALYLIVSNTPSQNSNAQALDLQESLKTSSLDTLFGLLANPRRRYILQCLHDFQTPMALADLASEVVSCEQGTPIPDIPDEEVKRAYISLYHIHIPKLAEANIVEYTEEQEMVTLSWENEHVEPLVELTTPNKEFQ